MRQPSKIDGAFERYIEVMRTWIRNLLHDWKFTAFAVSVLALGIAADAAAFTVLHAVLLRDLPFRSPDRLVWIWSTRTDRDKAFFSIPNFVDTRAQASTLSGIAAFANWPVNLTGGDEAERLQGIRLTANALEMLGAEPAAGRLIRPSDGQPGNERVVVLSYGVWQRRFAGSPAAIGTNVILNGISYVVIGVVRSDFVIPNANTDVIAPFVFESDPRRTQRGANFLRVFARLKPQTSIAQARAELTGITSRLRALYPDDNGKHTAPRIYLLADEIVGDYRSALWMLFAAVGVVLIIACGNLANLVAARAAARYRDVAVRAALGASRTHLIGQSIEECLFIAMAGGTAGCALAWWIVQGVTHVVPAGFPRVAELTMDWQVFLFTAVLSVITGSGLAMIPAWKISRIDINEVLRGTTRVTAGSVRSKTRSTLVIAEIALSFILLTGAGLLVRSFLRLQAVDSGIHPDNVLVGRMSIPADKYSSAAKLTPFLTALLDGIHQIPGVSEAAVASALPLSGVNSRTDFIVAGHPPSKAEDLPAAQTRWISEQYFRLMGIPIRRGRQFETFDRTESGRVGIVDEALAQRFMAGMDPLDQTLRIQFGDGQPDRLVKVVGVAGDVKHFGLDDQPTPTIYFPVSQVWPSALINVTAGMTAVVKTSTDPLRSADALRRVISATDSDIATSAGVSMEQMLESTIAPRKSNAVLMESFAAAGLVLAVIGLYAVLSYSVIQRRYEIAVRKALGASPQNVIGLVMGEGMKLAAIGIMIGVPVSLFVTRGVAQLLFQTPPADPRTYTGVALVLLFVSACASYFPARKAARTDPATQLVKTL